MGQKKVTLKDIAEYTGLATNTVSRVLNGKPYYTEEVERKVKDAIRRLGYISNSSASALKSGSTRTVAILYDDMVNPFYSYMTSIMAGRFSGEGYDTIIFSNYGKSAFIEYDLICKVLSRNPDAVVSFIEPAADAATVLRNYGIPFLIFGRDGSDSGFDSVCANEVEGGRIAAAHLLSKGRRDMIYIGTERSVKVCTDRLSGFSEALRQNGLTLAGGDAYFTKEQGFDFIADAVALRAGSGIFCYNDMIAFELLRRLDDKGFSVPKDFSIIGYDNIQGVLGLPPIITTVDVDNKQMADVGAEVLLLKMKNEQYRDRDFNKFHIPRLVPGGTT